MIAYKKYGVAKGTILTAWRLCRCNPLGITFFLSRTSFSILSCIQMYISSIRTNVQAVL